MHLLDSRGNKLSGLRSFHFQMQMTLNQVELWRGLRFSFSWRHVGKDRLAIEWDACAEGLADVFFILFRTQFSSVEVLEKI